MYVPPSPARFQPLPTLCSLLPAPRPVGVVYVEQENTFGEGFMGAGSDAKGARGCIGRVGERARAVGGTKTPLHHGSPGFPGEGGCMSAPSCGTTTG